MPTWFIVASPSLEPRRAVAILAWIVIERATSSHSALTPLTVYACRLHQPAAPSPGNRVPLPAVPDWLLMFEFRLGRTHSSVTTPVDDA